MTSRFTFIALLVAAAAGTEVSLVEGILARVNDRVITTADFRLRLVERAAETGENSSASQYPTILNEAIDELCLIERAAELKLAVEDAEVNNAIKQLREQNQIADDQTFNAMLQRTGLNLEQLRSRMRDTIAMNRVLSREVGSLPVTDEELRQRYANEKARFATPEREQLQHLVAPLPADAEGQEELRAEVGRLVAAARSGADFLALVQDMVTAGRASGGDLGEIQVTDLRTEVAAAVAGLKDNEISDPFEGEAGIHVVKLVKRIPPGTRPFEEVASELREREVSERYRARLGGVVSGLKKRYVVESHPELLSAVQPPPAIPPTP